LPKKTTVRVPQQINKFIVSEEPITVGKQKVKKPGKKTNPRKPKQQFDDSEEPAPEPGSDHSKGHHRGDPRTHPFHSWLYQKIDPKVRAARRKKFFGSGRRKRELSEEILLEIYPKDEENTEEQSTVSVQSRFHAFHSWQYQKTDPALQQARRQRLWARHHQPLPPRQPPHTVKRRSTSDGGGISINLGVKRFTIEDSMMDMLQMEQSAPLDTRNENESTSWSKQVDLMVSSSSLAVAFSIFLVFFFIILSLLLSIFNNRRYIVRKL